MGLIGRIELLLLEDCVEYLLEYIGRCRLIPELSINMPRNTVTCWFLINARKLITKFYNNGLNLKLVRIIENSLLRILQLYSWIENKMNTIVKKTQKKHK